MLERPIYQTTIVFLTVLGLIGGLVVLLGSHSSPGIEIVPAMPNVQVASADGNTPDVPDQAPPLVNINTASAEEMDEALPGIGPTLAARIVAYRNANGPFLRTDQLMLVDGIGETTVERLRELVTVGN